MILLMAIAAAEAIPTGFLDKASDGAIIAAVCIYSLSLAKDALRKRKNGASEIPTPLPAPANGKTLTEIHGMCRRNVDDVARITEKVNASQTQHERMIDGMDRTAQALERITTLLIGQEAILRDHLNPRRGTSQEALRRATARGRDVEERMEFYADRQREREERGES